jgi:hypothetical protein
MAQYSDPERPPYAKGNWKVMRRCCLGPGCSTCRWRAGGVQVAQFENVSEAYAKYAAKKWAAYGAVASVQSEPVVESA